MKNLYDTFYDPMVCLIRIPFQSPGYHTRVPDGTPVHPTNTSLCYALELVCRNNAACDERACSIIRKILPLQDKDPVSKTYGIWPWLYEEPLEAMAQPDWNWADFCGFRLAEILLQAEDRLPADLRAEMREALSHAAGAIYRRNVGAHYTNICVMGGVVTVLAGEILGDERMLSYGRRRLAEVVADHRKAGGFHEYNSPTYTRVVLWDCEQALCRIKDGEALESVRYLFHNAWKIVADHFHPATGQWAGPHSRDYTLFMTREFSRYLAFKTGVELHENPHAPLSTRVTPLIGWTMETHKLNGAPAHETFSAVHFNPRGERCPVDLVDCFRRRPFREREFRERYAESANETESIWGTTWMHEEACLGSVNHDFFMDQRRAVLGYWNGAAGTPVALRLRFLHDGREFSSARVCNAQAGARVLSAVHLLLGHGSFHPYLDVPRDATFYAEDFRLRYELRGDAVDAREIPAGFVLSSGEWEALITTAGGLFHGRPVKWKITRGEGWVAVDAVCHENARQAFPFRELEPMVLSAGLHLRRRGQEAEAVPLSIEHRPQQGVITSRWALLDVSVPDRAVPMPGRE